MDHWREEESVAGESVAEESVAEESVAEECRAEELNLYALEPQEGTISPKRSSPQDYERKNMRLPQASKYIKENNLYTKN